MKTSNQQLQPAGSEIVRSLRDGWSYNPGWRQQAIDNYLAEIAGAKDRTVSLQAILFRERDPYVRQGLRFRLTGECVHQRVIAWAFNAAQTNALNGVASRIRAGVIADRFVEEIADFLNIEPVMVSAFEKLFWDVRPYLGSELWLRTLIGEDADQKPRTSESVRETVWLRVAVEEGWKGLEKLWFRKRGTDSKKLDEMSNEVEGIALRRVMRHLHQMEERGEPVGDDDIKRLAIVSRRSPSIAEKGNDGGKMRDFFQQLLAIGKKNVLEQSPDSPKAQIVRMSIEQERKAVVSVSLQVRRRLLLA